MRIISGNLRGKKLFTPKDANVRPTTDRTRESIYNILYSKLDKPFQEYSILDIFSGTGAFGLEALSRGAKDATFVDIDLNLTKKNIDLCGFKNTMLIKSDARFIGKAKQTYDIVFMDAPYNKGLTEPVLDNLYKNNYLTPKTIIIVELAKNEDLNLDDRFNIIDTRIYGVSKVIFLNI